MTEYGPRTRTTQFSLKTPSFSDRYINGSFYDRQTFADFSWYTESGTMKDVVTEDFLERSRRGEIINNSCSRDITKKTYRNLNWSYALKNGTYRYSLIGNPGYLDSISDLPSDQDYTNAVNLAVTRARAKVTSEAIQIGATLGELKETKDMFISAAARLRHAGTLAHRYLDIISDPRKSHWDRAGQLIGTARNAWMEFRFGWRPFAGEAENFYSALRGLQEYPERKTFRAGEVRDYQNADETTRYLNSTMTWRFSRTTYVKTKIRAGVLAQQRYGGVPDVWGVTKIPQTIWELTRLSWAVDYFLNVGDLIAAYVPDSLWTPMADWVSTRIVTVSEVKQLGFISTNPWEQTSTGPSRTTERTLYIRTPSATPSIAIKRPFEDLSKTIDIVALTRVDASKWLRRAGDLARKLKRKV